MDNFLYFAKAELIWVILEIDWPKKLNSTEF